MTPGIGQRDHLHVLPEAVAYLRRYLDPVRTPPKLSTAGEVALVHCVLGALTVGGCDLVAVFAAISPGSGRRVFGRGTTPLPAYAGLRDWLIDERKRILGDLWPTEGHQGREESGVRRVRMLAGDVGRMKRGNGHG